MESQAERPSWADEVTELTLTEADALHAMGIPVYWAVLGEYGWDTRPFSRGPLLVEPSTAVRGRHYTYFLYIMKEI